MKIQVVLKDVLGVTHYSDVEDVSKYSEEELNEVFTKSFDGAFVKLQVAGRFIFFNTYNVISINWIKV
jgi:hypothetical protein